jgi:hypothetical protein
MDPQSQAIGNHDQVEVSVGRGVLNPNRKSFQPEDHAALCYRLRWRYRAEALCYIVYRQYQWLLKAEAN